MLPPFSTATKATNVCASSRTESAARPISHKCPLIYLTGQMDQRVKALSYLGEPFYEREMARGNKGGVSTAGVSGVWKPTTTSAPPLVPSALSIFLLYRLLVDSGGSCSPVEVRCIPLIRTSTTGVRTDSPTFLSAPTLSRLVGRGVLSTGDLLSHDNKTSSVFASVRLLALDSICDPPPPLRESTSLLRDGRGIFPGGIPDGHRVLILNTETGVLCR